MNSNPPLPPIGRGRPAGVPNRATTDARRAIADFVDGNVERLGGWLEAIAEGIPDKKDETGAVTKWLRQPDPDGAFKAYMSVIEYHIPKLARKELVGDPENPIEHRHLVVADSDIISRYNHPEKT